MAPRLIASLLIIAAAVGRAGAVPTGNAFLTLGTTNPCPIVEGIDAPSFVEVSPDGRFVYAIGDTLSTWRRLPNGFLRFVDDIENGEGGVSGLSRYGDATALSPDGSTLYYLAYGRILAFDRDAGSGLLTWVQTVLEGQGGVTGLVAPTNMAVSPDGEHLYVTGHVTPSGKASIATFDRDPLAGSLTFVEAIADGQGGITDLYRSRAVTVSPDGAFVYVTGATASDLSSSSVVVLVFARDAGTGRLTLTSEIEPDEGEGLSVSISPDGAFAYVARAVADLFSADGSVMTFDRNMATGALTWLPPADVSGFRFVLSPDGAFGYSTWSGSLYIHARNPVTGRLSQVAVQSSTNYQRPPTSSPDGQHMFGVDLGRLDVYSRDAMTGLTSYLDRMRAEPNFLGDLAMAPDGRHVYAACVGKTVIALARDAGTGDLSVVDVAEQGFAGDALNNTEYAAISPDGRHLYVQGETANGPTMITAFARDDTTGALSFVQSVPCECQPLHVSPDGKSLYTLVRYADTIQVYDRDATSGALTLRESHHANDPGVSGLANATHLLVSADGGSVYVAGSAAITAWARSAATGALSFVAAEPFANAAALAGTDDGLAVYAPVPGKLDVLARDPVTSRLTLLEAMPHQYAQPAIVMPDGRQFLVDGPDGTTVLRRDRRTNLLSFAGILSSSASFSFHGLVASPDSRHVYTARFGSIIRFERKVLCASTPQAGCRRPTAPRKSVLQLSDRDDLDRNKLSWKWSAGEATPLSAFGAPQTTTDFALCLYDASAVEQPVVAAGMPGGSTCPTGPCWRGSGVGFTYLTSRADPDGVKNLSLRSGVAGRASFKLKAAGGAIPAPDLPLTPPLTAQLQASNGECWEASFSLPSVNDDERVKAKSD